ncbi:zinc finger protein 850 [Lampris incognitus]|uniref:zinc finger protein 850 n=1 Tax=Lampris incognitus TaxID=2546036 RepID=UPI0024B58C3C|nr:zinc finger protein 850 [Lampris incognitus]
MTLTFYYKHQRLVHSDETPAKSFLHQVDQLQKKAFECKNCGLRFSRASALQSHQLHHTNVFGDAEKEDQRPYSLLTQQKVLEGKREETQQLEEEVELQDTLQTAEGDSYTNEMSEDGDGYETGDFNVEVISASESDEEEPLQDLNPDLELLCESDQEVKEEIEAETEVSSSSLVLKPELDLKIVQIDFEQVQDQGTSEIMEAEDKTSVERFDCPECSRSFPSASSLRVHRMWHRLNKKRQWTQSRPTAVYFYTCDICGHETSSRVTHYNHLQKHKDRKPYKNVLDQTEGLEKRTFKCDECGKCFSRMSALSSHQLHHPKRKPYPCPNCMLSYSHASGLYNHRKNCPAHKKDSDDISVTNKEFNPKKTLLGPKIYHCEQCGKGFWSLGAYSHHKQSQARCANLIQKNSPSTSLHTVNGHTHSSAKVACPVCGRKFRHRGIMKSHMRKHENGNHKCELCNRSFRVFSGLLRHQVVHNARALPPPVKSFQHQVEQVKKNTYSCPDCGKLFSRAKALQFHMKSHGYETGYLPSSPKSNVTPEELQCSTCLAHFNNKSSLRAHQKLCIKRDCQEHQYLKEPTVYKTNLKCPNCLSCFSSVLMFQRHSKFCRESNAKGDMERKEKGGSDRVTMDAEKNKPDTGELKMDYTAGHSLKNLSTADLKYKCKECERSFSVVGALNFHKRIHLQSHKSKAKTKAPLSIMLKKPKLEQQSKGLFYCAECGRRFTTNSALGTHKRWHTDKKFAGSLVKVNINSVTSKTADEGPFQCNKCGKRFFYLCVLRRHQLYYPPCQTKTEPQFELNESVESSGKSQQTEFTCPECNKTFIRGSSLAAHYENEHSKSVDTARPHGEQSQISSPVQAPGQADVNPSECDAISSKKSKLEAYQCPLCSLSFAKFRGLCAHKWQAHSECRKTKSYVPLNTTKSSIALSSKDNNEEISVVNDNTLKRKYFVAKKKGARGRKRKKSRYNLPPLKSIPCLDCGKRYSSAGALCNHRKVCLELRQEPEQEIKPPEKEAEVPPPLSCQPEHTAKYLFKCDKCGKAFLTEEQLGTHKTQAKSRPYCCALCCHGCWTETQLQQHLAWHDEVRRRLPIELRYRLSAAMTSRPPKSITPSPDGKSSPSSTLNSVSRPQTSHKCQHCGKAFLSPTALQKHESQHTSDDAYHCSLCPRTFSEIQDLIDHHQDCMHDRKEHNDASAAVSSGDTDGLTCLECGMSFHQENELHQHYIEHARGVH